MMMMMMMGMITILAATPIPTSPANQQATYVQRLDAGVVIRGVESSGAPNLRASETSFEAFGASWGPPGGLMGASKICKFWFRNGFGRKKSSNRSKKVVAKGLREAFGTENGNPTTRGTGGRGDG